MLGGSNAKPQEALEQDILQTATEDFPKLKEVVDREWAEVERKRFRARIEGNEG